MHRTNFATARPVTGRPVTAPATRPTSSEEIPPSAGSGGLWRDFAAFLPGLLSVICLSGWFFRFGLPVLLPFLIAFALSWPLFRPVRYLQSRFRIPLRLSAVLCVLLPVGLSAFLTVQGLRRAAREAGHLLSLLADREHALTDPAASLRHWLSRFPPFSRLWESPRFPALADRLETHLTATLSRLIGELSVKLPALAVRIAQSLPDILLTSVILCLSAYYFIADGDRLLCAGQSLLARLPGTVREKLSFAVRRAKTVLFSYLRAGLLLGLLTFAELFIGLSVLRVPFAFLIGAAVAVVDFLPFLGTGIVLLPWAAVCLLTGDFRLGCGLLVLYALTLLVRRIAEPPLVGAVLGLHPLFTVFSLYAGYRWFGLAGMLLAPLFVSLSAACLRPFPRSSGKNSASPLFPT